MSHIKVDLATQLKAAAQCDGLEIECNTPMSVSNLLQAVIDRHGELQSMLLDDSGVRHGWLMVSVDDAMVARGSDPDVQPGSTVLLCTPISGG